jgi:Zn-dependent membrane protease YugP
MSVKKLSVAMWRIGVALQHTLGLPNLMLLSQDYSQVTNGALMSTWQAILCGMLLSWTPSLFFLAWVVWKERMVVEDI